MIHVDVDMAPYAAQLGSFMTEVGNAVVARLGEFLKARVAQLTKDGLPIAQRQNYLKGIEIDDATPGRFSIELTGAKNIALEEGNDAFDIKTGLLASSKAKQSKAGGKYIDVPLPHTVSPRGGGHVIQPGNMRDAVKKAMERVRVAGGKERVEGSKGSITEGMIVEKDVGADLGATSKTIRRVSDKSASDSWMYPKRDGLKAFEKAAEEVEQVKDEVIADTIAEMTT